MAAGRAPRTVRRQYGTLRAILNHAVASDMIARTPCRSIKLPGLEPLARPVVTADDLVRLVEALPAECRPMVHLGAVLGLRWGECAGLRVARLDFFARTLMAARLSGRRPRGPRVPRPEKRERHGARRCRRRPQDSVDANGSLRCAADSGGLRPGHRRCRPLRRRRAGGTVHGCRRIASTVVGFLAGWDYPGSSVRTGLDCRGLTIPRRQVSPAPLVPIGAELMVVIQPQTRS